MIWKGSPNYDTNRTQIDEIFIHWIVGPLSAADVVFQKVGGTSAHYGIEDNTIHQYVKEEHVAYHAGVYSHNQRSIGIEHSASPDRPASDATYNTSGKLIAEICKRYNIPLDRQHIRGHKEVRNTQCPGTMDIDRLINIAKSQGEEDPRIRRDNLWNTLNKVGGFYDVKVDEDLNKTELKFLADSERRKKDYDNKVAELEECESKSVTVEMPISETSNPIPTEEIFVSTQEEEVASLPQNEESSNIKPNDTSKEPVFNPITVFIDLLKKIFKL